MKIGFVSYYGDAADIAFRMALDGDSVRLYIEDPKYKNNFDGIVPKAKAFDDLARWADFLVFDDNKLSHLWAKAHKTVPCFGGSSFSAKLEDDRAFAHSLMDRVGIPRIESKSFKTLADASKHIKEHKVPHVVKPTGKKVESHHLIIGEEEDGSDVIPQIEHLIEQGLQVESVEVEEKKKGVEVGLSIWFNGQDVVGPINVNHEHKRIIERETGPLSGEAGTLMKYSEDSDLPLYKETLAKMIPVLRAADFRGQIDLNMIVGEDENGRFIAPLEFTPRLGKPSVFIEDELHVTPWGKLFHGIATGQKTDLQVHYDWAVGVVLFGFGFPFEDKHEMIGKGLAVRGIDEHTLEHFHPMQLLLDKKGQFVCGQGEGYIGVATGRGDYIQEAKERAYQNISPIKCPNSFKRFDISDKINIHELERLEILPLEEARH